MLPIFALDAFLSALALAVDHLEDVVQSNSILK
jgi:hypothetical protein